MCKPLIRRNLFSNGEALAPAMDNSVEILKGSALTRLEMSTWAIGGTGGFGNSRPMATSY